MCDIYSTSWRDGFAKGKKIITLSFSLHKWRCCFAFCIRCPSFSSSFFSPPTLVAVELVLVVVASIYPLQCPSLDECALNLRITENVVRLAGWLACNSFYIASRNICVWWQEEAKKGKWGTKEEKYSRRKEVDKGWTNIYLSLPLIWVFAVVVWSVGRPLSGLPMHTTTGG